MSILCWENTFELAVSATKWATDGSFTPWVYYSSYLSVDGCPYWAYKTIEEEETILFERVYILSLNVRNQL